MTMKAEHRDKLPCAEPLPDQDAMGLLTNLFDAGQDRMKIRDFPDSKVVLPERAYQRCLPKNRPILDTPSRSTSVGRV
jgi:hypothetical protein